MVRLLLRELDFTCPIGLNMKLRKQLLENKMWRFSEMFD